MVDQPRTRRTGTIDWNVDLDNTDRTHVLLPARRENPATTDQAETTTTIRTTKTTGTLRLGDRRNPSSTR
jgi:hypothetical protein